MVTSNLVNGCCYVVVLHARLNLLCHLSPRAQGWNITAPRSAISES